MNKFLFLLTLNFSLFTAQAHASDPALNDFAAGHELIADDGGAIYRVPLPAAVYQHVTRDDLGDIRVFNRAGQRVPHAVRRQETITTERTAKLELPFFPVPGETERQGGDDLDIQIADDGRIINIQYQGEAAQTDPEEIRQYLIDSSGVQQRIDELEFELGGNEDGYLKRVMLEASDDLNRWYTVVDNVTLSELVYAGHALNKNTIQLAGGRYKYLRLSFRDDPAGLRIGTVRAMLSSVTGERRKTWTTVSGARSEKDKRMIEFDTGGRFLIEEINILLPEDNTLAEATLRSRNDRKADWRPSHAGLFYRLHMKGTQLEQEPVAIHPTTDRYWQLEVRTEDNLGLALPQLQFAWFPDELYFLARGSGPYTLAFGNANADAPGKPIDALIRVLSEEQESELIQQATLGDPVALKGAAALQPDRKIPWQRILLWSVLILGVLIIAVMALRLFRQINHQE